MCHLSVQFTELVASWLGGNCFTPDFSLWENFRKIFCLLKDLGLITTRYVLHTHCLTQAVRGKFWQKIELLSTHNLLCQKVATDCQSSVAVIWRTLQISNRVGYRCPKFRFSARLLVSNPRRHSTEYIVCCYAMRVCRRHIMLLW